MKTLMQKNMTLFTLSVLSAAVGLEASYAQQGPVALEPRATPSIERLLGLPEYPPFRKPDPSPEVEEARQKLALAADFRESVFLETYVPTRGNKSDFVGMHDDRIYGLTSIFKEMVGRLPTQCEERWRNTIQMIKTDPQIQQKAVALWRENEKEDGSTPLFTTNQRLLDWPKPYLITSTLIPSETGETVVLLKLNTQNPFIVDPSIKRPALIEVNLCKEGLSKKTVLTFIEQAEKYYRQQEAARTGPVKDRAKNLLKDVSDANDPRQSDNQRKVLPAVTHDATQTASSRSTSDASGAY